MLLVKSCKWSIITALKKCGAWSHCSWLSNIGMHFLVWWCNNRWNDIRTSQSFSPALFDTEGHLLHSRLSWIWPMQTWKNENNTLKITRNVISPIFGSQWHKRSEIVEELHNQKHTRLPLFLYGMFFSCFFLNLNMLFTFFCYSIDVLFQVTFDVNSKVFGASRYFSITYPLGVYGCYCVKVHTPPSFLPFCTSKSNGCT